MRLAVYWFAGCCGGSALFLAECAWKRDRGGAVLALWMLGISGSLLALVLP